MRQDAGKREFYEASGIHASIAIDVRHRDATEQKLLFMFPSAPNMRLKHNLVHNLKKEIFFPMRRTMKHEKNMWQIRDGHMLTLWGSAQGYIEWSVPLE